MIIFGKNAIESSKESSGVSEQDKYSYITSGVWLLPACNWEDTVASSWKSLWSLKGARQCLPLTHSPCLCSIDGSSWFYPKYFINRWFSIVWLNFGQLRLLLLRTSSPSSRGQWWGCSWRCAAGSRRSNHRCTRGPQRDDAWGRRRNCICRGLSSSLLSCCSASIYSCSPVQRKSVRNYRNWENKVQICNQLSQSWRYLSDSERGAWN